MQSLTLSITKYSKALENYFGIQEIASNWIMSYLQNRQFQPHINGTSLEKMTRNYSVPQGSIHGPLLFNCYSSTIQEIIPNNMSGYADDHSLTESFKPGNTTIKEKLESTVNNVRKWMIENHLKMNDSKMEFMVFGTRYNLDKHIIPSLKVGDSDIINNKNIRFLGVTLDPHLTFKNHITTKS